MSSAIRSAAPLDSAPWSGCAARRRRRNRFWMSSRSIFISAFKPSTSIAHRRSDGMPSHFAPSGRVTPFHASTGPLAASGGRSWGRREGAGERSAARGDPRLRDRGFDHREAPSVGGLAHRRRGHHRADHLGNAGGVDVELDDEHPVLTEQPVARAVEPVDVVLEPVAQGDAGDVEAVRALKRNLGRRSRCSWSEPEHVLGDDRREQRRAVGGTVHRQVAGVERSRVGICQAGVADVQLGQDHACSPQCSSPTIVPDGER